MSSEGMARHRHELQRRRKLDAWWGRSELWQIIRWMMHDLNWSLVRH